MPTIESALPRTFQAALDHYAGVYRLWTRLPHDGRTLAPIRKAFPALERVGEGPLYRLGGFASRAEALAALADAKMRRGTCERFTLVYQQEDER